MSSLTLSRWFWFPRFAMVQVGCLVGACFCFALSSVHAQSQAAMNAEARADFARADAELNKIYDAFLKKLPDGQGKEMLKKSQRAWLAFRDAEAAFAADEAGGTMAPTIRYGTMTELTQERIKQLKNRSTD